MEESESDADEQRPANPEHSDGDTVELRPQSLKSDTFESLLNLPDHAVEECPLRGLKFLRKLMTDFQTFREKLLTQFYQLNAGFKQQDFDRCLNCWVKRLYNC